MSDQGYGHPIYLYAAALQEATRSNDTSKMRELAQQAESHLKEVSSALDELRAALGRQNS